MLDKKLPISDLDEILDKFSTDYSQFVEIGKEIGAENLNVMLDVLGGQKPHVPMRKNFYAGLNRTIRDDQIRLDFKGNNHGELASENELNERQIRAILDKAKKKYKRPAETLQSCKIKPDDHDMIVNLSSQYCGAPMHSILNVMIDIAMHDHNFKKILNEKFGVQLELVS